MTYLRIAEKPQHLQGSIPLPSSKSISSRALIIRALSGYDFPIHNISLADDTQLLKAILDSGDEELYVKNAGTAMRFLTAFFACKEGETVLRGNERMHKRPVGDLVDALRALGADITYLEEEGFPPILVRGGQLRGGRISIRANVSSQFISALLLIAPMLRNGLEIELKGEIASLPYIQLTLNLMKYFGVESDWKGNTIRVSQQRYLPKELFVEADWSSASYFYALASLFPGSSLHMPYLFQSSMQGDSIIQHWMEKFGVTTEFHISGCHIRSENKRPAYFEEDMLAHPDLIPTMSSLCCTLKIPFYINGTRTLQYKESRRDIVLKEELGKLGYPLMHFPNSLTLEHYEGELIPEGDISLETHEDHRMAMSWTIPASQAPYILIHDPYVTEKSYPEFWRHLEGTGFRLAEADSLHLSEKAK